LYVNARHGVNAPSAKKKDLSGLDGELVNGRFRTSGRRRQRTSGTDSVLRNDRSWNDMGFDGEDQKDYVRLSEALFQALNAAIVAAANASLGVGS
jgi:hypothetical protein